MREEQIFLQPDALSEELRTRVYAELGKHHRGVSDVAEAMGLSRQHVRDVLQGKKEDHQGIVLKASEYVLRKAKEAAERQARAEANLKQLKELTCA